MSVPEESAYEAGIQELFTRSRLPMLLADDEGRYVAANQAARNLLRLPEAEILRRSVGDFSPPAIQRRVPQLWRELLEAGTLEGDFEVLLPDGTRIQTEVSVTANVEPGRHLAIILVPRQPETAVDGANRRLDATIPPPRSSAAPVISPREREVLRLLALGASGAEIARELHISPETVRNHVRSARTKLGAKSRTHAIALALQLGEIQL